ncbi:hypothetical protein BT96DRAFT_1019221 [Gymnopus androsaceus JB14]|uniref:Uncharacterized protein n=1 Tax=Gymnopus androsaceus JB14 TaxID=1447944 RepID=A0A6A4HLV5_9AGAR|nr:hypothetical protein BT96DRAFT_1019221 [Gymnopus androsaceus JB14]
MPSSWNPMRYRIRPHESFQSQKQRLVNILVFAAGIGSTIAGYKNNSVPVTVLGVVGAVGSLISSGFSEFKSAPEDVEAQTVSTRRHSVGVPEIELSSSTTQSRRETVADPDALKVDEPSLGEAPEVIAADCEQWEEQRDDITTAMMRRRTHAHQRSSKDEASMSGSPTPVTQTVSRRRNSVGIPQIELSSSLTQSRQETVADLGALNVYQPSFGEGPEVTVTDREQREEQREYGITASRSSRERRFYYTVIGSVAYPDAAQAFSGTGPYRVRYSFRHKPYSRKGNSLAEHSYLF